MFESFHCGYVSDRVTDPTTTLPRSAVPMKSFTLIPGDSVDYKFVACTVSVPLCTIAVMSPADINIGLFYHSLNMHVNRRASSDFKTLQHGLFSAPLADTTHVNLENQHDFGSTIPQVVGGPGRQVLPGCHPLVTLTDDDGLLKDCSFVVPFNEAVDDFPATCQPVATPAGHPCGLRLQLGSKHSSLLCPSLMKLNTPTIQVNRESSYCKVTVKPGSFDVQHDRFLPLYHDKNSCQVMFWDLPYVDLEALPLVNNAVGADQSEWLNNLAGAQISFPEREQGMKLPISAYKSTIHALLLNIFGHTPESDSSLRPRWFGLETESSGIVITVFVNAIRFDASIASVVIDAAVSYLTPENVGIVGPFFQTASASLESFLVIKITEGEYKFWRKSYPTLCERARVGWVHDESCEYNGQGFVPSSPHVCPVCSCALSKSLDDSPFSKLYREHDAYKYFFRAAISPLFPWSGPGSAKPSPKDSTLKQTTPTCAECSEKAKRGKSLLRCARCRSSTEAYCNAACQKAHWPIHKKTCKKVEG